MRAILTILFAAQFSFVPVTSFAVDFASSNSETVNVAAAPNVCVDKCEKQKQQCFAEYTKSDSTSGNYVTPEGHKVCWAAYHECKKNCPR